MRALRLVPIVVAVAACSTSPEDASCSAAVPMDVVQTQVFDGCSVGNFGCHAHAPFGANLDLTRGNAYAYLLHAPSSSSPGKWRVEPGDLAQSFLWRKLTDTIATDASEGAPMPRNGADKWAPLSATQLAAVRCWIMTGAGD